MPRYKVAVYGGMDGLTFEDLVVTYSSGYRFPLKVKQGCYVPVEIFDPLDIQKSLAVGTLSVYVKSGAVKVEYSDIEQHKHQRKPRQKKQEAPVLTPSVVTVQPVLQKPEDTQVAPSAPIDLKPVDPATDFFAMSYYQKLKFIQNCTDKSVLTDLLQKSTSDQMKSHLGNKLATL